MNMQAAAAYCRDKAAPPGSSLYYSCLYLLPEQKQAMYALHCFSNEIAGVLEECADPGVARIKFAWWQDEMQRLFQHQPRHPVSHELQKLMAVISLQPENLNGIIRHYEQRLNRVQPLEYEQLQKNLLAGPGELWRLSALIFTTDTAQLDTAGHLGSLFGIFELLQQRPLRIIDKPATLTRQLLTDIENDYDRLMNNNNALLCALIMARIIRATCQEILKDAEHMGQQRVSLTPLRKLWIAWRTKMMYL